MNATLASARPGTRPDLDQGPGLAGRIGFGGAIVAAVLDVAYRVYADASAVGRRRPVRSTDGAAAGTWLVLRAMGLMRR